MRDFDAFARDALPSLTALGRAVSVSRDDASDLVSETLFRCFRKWRVVSSMENPMAYARKILSNLSVDHKRREARRPELESLNQQRGRVHDRDLSADAISRERTRTMLSQLDPKERTVLVLRYYMDLDFKQIGEVLDMNESTVRSWSHRALAKVRKQAADASL